MRMVTNRIGLAVLMGFMATRACAQSTASLVTDAGSEAGVTVAFTASTTAFGNLNGTDSTTAATTGTAEMTLLPTYPQFSHAILHSVHFEMDTVVFGYSFLAGFVTAQVTFTDLTLDSTGPAYGGIAPTGDTAFPDVPFHVAGSAHIVCNALGVNETRVIDDVSLAQLDASIREAAGALTLDSIAVPAFEVDIPAGELPAGVNSVVVNVTVDATDVVLRGPWVPALPGDWDGDGDLDLADYAAMSECLNGPDVPATGFCMLFDLDDDGDVDLADFAVFQSQ